MFKQSGPGGSGDGSQQDVASSVPDKPIAGTPKKCPLAEEAAEKPKVSITPYVICQTTEAWVDEEDTSFFKPHILSFGITESADDTGYEGAGYPACSSGALFTDEECTAEYGGKASAAELREGLRLYMKTEVAGDFSASIKLDPASAVHQKVGKEQVTKIVILGVDLLTPKILPATKVVLLSNIYATDDGKTSPTELELSVEQSQPGRLYDGLTCKLSFDSSVISIYKDVQRTQECPADSMLDLGDLTGRVPLKLYAFGKKEGKTTLKLEPQLDGSESAVKTLPCEEREVSVVKLLIDVFVTTSAKTYEGDQDAKVAEDKKSEKGRLLHFKNGDIFKRGRIDVKKPDDEFWTAAGDMAEVVLTAKRGPGVDGIRIFLAENGGDGVAEIRLKKADLESADKSIWLVSEGETGRVTDPVEEGPEGFNPNKKNDYPAGIYATEAAYFDARYGAGWTARPSEMENKIAYVHVSAAVQNYAGEGAVELKNADETRIQAFSLDREMDRATRNACHKKIRATSKSKLGKLVAIAYASLHGTYLDFENVPGASGLVPHTNHTTFDVFKAFAKKAGEEGTQAGVDYIVRHIRDDCGVHLHAVTQSMIKRHLDAIITTDPRVDNDDGSFYYGFNSFDGLPGSHAEVLAVNEIIQYLQRNGGAPAFDPETLGKITVATYKLIGKIGKRFTACKNCYGILNKDNLRIITENLVDIQPYAV